jgi:hypothetical protein
MKTRIFSETELNEVLNKDCKMPIAFWDKMKEKMRELDIATLKQLSVMLNPAVRYMAKSVLLERGAIRI